MNTIIENGKITGTMLGKEDHGIMTFWLFVEFDSGVCGYGGYALDSYDAQTKKRIGAGGRNASNRGNSRLCRRCKWEDLTGAFIRCEHQGWGGKIIRIGNLIKDKWFSLEAFFKEVKEAGGGE